VPTRFRCAYVRHSDAVVTFRCLNCQRLFTVDYSRLPRAKRILAGGVALLAKWWVQGHDIAGGCRRCESAAGR